MINDKESLFGEQMHDKLGLTRKQYEQLSDTHADEYGIEDLQRMMYRMNCKHYLSETCAKFSQTAKDGNWHVTIACTPQSKCARLQRFDKKTK
jgi:hypothetical protein